MNIAKQKNNMNEIKRLQQLAGILTEIKVNNPNRLRAIEREDGNFNLYIGEKIYEGIPEDDVPEGQGTYSINNITEEDVDYIYSKIDDEYYLDDNLDGDESFVVLSEKTFYFK